MTWYYLSFADSDRPSGERFLGALILEASGVVDAARRAHAIGENPGGEVLSWEITDLPPEEYRARLLSKDDLRDMNEKMGLGRELTNVGGRSV